MSALRFHGPVLPSGEVQDLYVVDGRVTYHAPPHVETAGRGWIVPGLVDAHCHLGLGEEGAVSEEETIATAIEDRDAGALLIRDCGSPIDTRFVQEREDLPRLVRAGRHVARTRRYLPGYGVEVEPRDLALEIARQAERGDGWVKIVGDWISRADGDLLPTFPAADLAEAIATAHRHGAKVTAHCFGPEVLPGLIKAGIDCIEHGTGLTLELVEEMARRGTALVPTVMQTDKFLEFSDAGRGKFPVYADRMKELHARRREVLMSAFEAGVPLFAGTDGGGEKRHGNLANEVLAMHAMGIPAEDALAAASWKGRAWLGFGALEEGSEADFVVYDEDPRADLTVLHTPSAVVLRGKVVA
ncbi:amidohydrolase family protein [Nocardioides sp.]|uniref:amidohydrolase family protein n=1 Tax=Nocardioides sp. TaxID=35761 RepID=UPI002B9EF145|nr:amidohydrolase family protein [Nocardioides sp.]HSX67549.1 amidohydrolase family protein [Nocardioides sp.]